MVGIQPASAQSSAAEISCYSSKLSASKYGAKQLGKCHANLAKGGTLASFDACLLKVTTAVTSRVNAADAAADRVGFLCPGDMDTLKLDGQDGWQTTLVENMVFQTNLLPSSCVQKRAVALSKYASKYADCSSRGFGMTAAAIDACAATTLASTQIAWGKAGVCQTSDFHSARLAVDAAIDAQAELLRISCGNGETEGFEQCDDGDAQAGDGCEPDCTLTLRCGNGVTQPENSEQCDDANQVLGDGCDNDCIVEECGNAVVQHGEACDAGGESAACDDDCTPVSCRDGNPNQAANEQCDTAGESASCDSNCTVAVCGDGTHNATRGEQCDAAGESSSCDADCTVASCGDGTHNVTRGEQCDGAGETATCDANCTVATCGDGTHNATRGEQCDAAGQSATCDTDCTVATCGDGTHNATRGEQCDTAGQSATCDTDCTTAVCGDSTTNAARGEQCDDGAETASCDANCTVAVCGDGTRNATRGEQCDSAGQSATCDTDCSNAFCGDGTLNVLASESCDAGGESAACDANCTPAVCGDTTLNLTANEQCDDGNNAPDDGCDAACHEEGCGDDWRQSDEECDDGNGQSGDGCSSSCDREDCGVVNGVVKCRFCPAGSGPDAAYTGCVCDAGFQLVNGVCVDINECALGTHTCTAQNPCVNVPGTYSCATQCTSSAFHAALAACGGPTRYITFNCTNTTISIADGSTGRSNSCNNLVVDGLDRNITFEMTPKCWGRVMSAGNCRVDLNPDGTCDCPDVNNGTYFMTLTGENQTIRNLTIMYFFDGIHTAGNNNNVENVTIDHNCDDSIGSNSGVGHIFKEIHAKTACGKCMQNYGTTSATSPEPLLRQHYNAILRDSLFTDCQQPVRMTDSGRYLIEGTRMEGNFDSGIYRCLGPRFDGGGTNNQIVHITDSEVEGCDRGIRVGGTVQALVWRNTLVNNGFRGLLAMSSSKVAMWDNIVMGNGGIGSSELGLGGVGVDESATLDLGGGSQIIEGEHFSSPGGNILCGNVAPNGTPREVHNVTTTTTKAEHNWWCSLSPQTRVTGPVDTDPFLTQEP